MATGHLAENILYFSRLLRAAGIPVASSQVLQACEAVEIVGLDSRQDLYHALQAQFLSRRAQQPLFDQAFHLFWRNRRLRERLLAEFLPRVEAPGSDPAVQAASRRLSEAMAPTSGTETRPTGSESRELQAGLSASPRELLQRKDFEQMSIAEQAEARALLRKLRLPTPLLKSRRQRRAHGGGRIDMRATLREALRSDAALPLKFKRPRLRPAPLVILVDISGSMSQYSRMFLHFLHAVSNDRERIHSFVFGTRLNNISRHLRQRDVDVALARAASQVQDWAGGTRITACLRTFNRDWSRRVLAQGAVVLLLSDGLERDPDGTAELKRQMERLRKSCRRLVWLNPLLRFEGFAPRAAGVRAMLPYVDEFVPAHNLDSLMDLARILILSERKPLAGPGLRRTDTAH